ncbi:hypothetical protein Zmor_005528 [Zophobas morio]|uniref:Uncharacterized protein n=1 Tax=Zophobas morio TaxID=2755281 RepID=A0AA38IPV0_9CUCU|nr:hypothetical protein Zmor_005528 [Zophobas morio]
MTNTRRRYPSSSFRCRRQKRVLAVLAPPCVPSWSLRRRQANQSRVVFGEHIELPTRRREEVVRVRCVAYINITATPQIQNLPSNIYVIEEDFLIIERRNSLPFTNPPPYSVACEPPPPYDPPPEYTQISIKNNESLQNH